MFIEEVGSDYTDTSFFSNFSQVCENEARPALCAKSFNKTALKKLQAENPTTLSTSLPTRLPEPKSSLTRFETSMFYEARKMLLEETSVQDWEKLSGVEASQKAYDIAGYCHRFEYGLYKNPIGLNSVNPMHYFRTQIQIEDLRKLYDGYVRLDLRKHCPLPSTVWEGKFMAKILRDLGVENFIFEEGYKYSLVGIYIPAREFEEKIYPFLQN